MEKNCWSCSHFIENPYDYGEEEVKGICNKDGNVEFVNSGLDVEGCDDWS